MSCNTSSKRHAAASCSPGRKAADPQVWASVAGAPRYEEEHQTRSCRLTRSGNRHLDELLEGTGFSFGGFVRSWLGKFDGSMDAGAAKTRPARRGSLLDELITKAGV